VKIVAGSEPAPTIVAAGYDWNVWRHEVEQYLHGELHAAEGRVPEGIDAHAELIAGPPSDVLADASREPGTILVVGSRGYGPVRSVLLGSVSRTLADSAPAPLIVVARGARPGGDRTEQAERALVNRLL
jgi:nucleotide-binding universal stress UspA family protein